MLKFCKYFFIKEISLLYITDSKRQSKFGIHKKFDFIDCNRL